MGSIIRHRSAIVTRKMAGRKKKGSGRGSAPSAFIPLCLPQNFLDLRQTCGKMDALLPVRGGQALFDHVLQ